MEFMNTQDKRAAHQERCVSDMAKQVGKLAKAVEGLCSALGPAVRDGINHTLGPQVREVHTVAAEVRRAAEDINHAAATLRRQPGGGDGGASLSLSGAQGQQDAHALTTALVPQIEAIVLQAFEGKQLVANAMAAVASMSRDGGNGGEPQPQPQKPARKPMSPPKLPPLQQELQLQRQQQSPQRHVRGRSSEAGESVSPGDAAGKKGTTPHQMQQKQWEEETRAQQQRTHEERHRQLHLEQHQQQQRGGGGVGPRAPVNLSEEEVKKIHSAVRWNKPLGELAAIVAGPDQANCVDPKNGNRPLHIAAQNGFVHVCKLLIAKGADVNAVNHKNNTALHMALGYDYVDCASFLYDSGADRTIVNSEGHAAKNGLEGDKGQDGYLSPVSELREARTVGESLAAIRRIASEGYGDKAELARVGLIMKKSFPDSWTQQVQAAFQDLMMSLPREK